MEEIFKDVKGYEDYYQVSNFGRIKSKTRTITYINKNGKVINYVMEEKILATRLNNMGYVLVDFMVDQKKVTRLVHKVVAEAFLENPNNYDQVDHKDGNKQHNYDYNLEYVTQSENIKHAHQNNNHISDEAKERLRNNVKGVSPEKRKKKVLQMDLEGNILNEYESIISASKSVGIDRTSIRNAITGYRGTKTAKGYKWKFKE